MGLSVVSATLVIFTVVALTSTHLAREIVAGSTTLDLARHEEIIRDGQRYDTKIEITACCTWTGILLRTIVIEVKNSGITVLNASRPVTNVLVDGLLKPTSDITSATVGGVAADTWAPNDKLVLAVKNVGTSPLFIEVVASNGAVALWRPV